MIRRRDLVWIGWTVSTLGSFAALEMRALRSRRFPTLSESLSRWLGTQRSDIGLIVFGAGFLCLTLHLARYSAPDHREVGEG